MFHYRLYSIALPLLLVTLMSVVPSPAQALVGNNSRPRGLYGASQGRANTAGRLYNPPSGSFGGRSRNSFGVGTRRINSRIKQNGFYTRPRPARH